MKIILLSIPFILAAASLHADDEFPGPLAGWANIRSGSSTKCVRVSLSRKLIPGLMENVDLQLEELDIPIAAGHLLHRLDPFVRTPQGACRNSVIVQGDRLRRPVVHLMRSDWEESWRNADLGKNPHSDAQYKWSKITLESPREDRRFILYSVE